MADAENLALHGGQRSKGMDSRDNPSVLELACEGLPLFVRRRQRAIDQMLSSNGTLTRNGPTGSSKKRAGVVLVSGSKRPLTLISFLLRRVGLSDPLVVPLEGWAPLSLSDSI